ncbi:unnamed protein product [Rotaria magnacalcarata]|uniref:Uncharacterized protein n=1 Tax=Rotaria magnacalcarata TaxID=392030 RepID=A0A815D5E4_9BILA|nr:unnamed protein product [Rotaria magnacalcarata]CAF3873520.1 unnamed protein product [Rotaria magnacalcarata]
MRHILKHLIISNRLKDLSRRFQTRRMEIVQSLLSASEKVFDRLLPKIDQKSIHERIVNFVRKLLASFEQVAKRNSEQWKAIFKAIDDASKVAAETDDKLTKVFKKLGNSSKLLISNMQKISQRINQRRECIRHLQKASMNNTNFEILYSIDRRPGTNSETSKLVLLMSTLLN